MLPNRTFPVGRSTFQSMLSVSPKKNRRGFNVFKTFTGHQKGFDSVGDLTSNGWQNVALSISAFTVSSSRLVVPVVSNDTTSALQFDISGLDTWEWVAQIYLQGSSWGGAQWFMVMGGDWPDYNVANWNYNPGMWFVQTTAGGYGSASWISNGALGIGATLSAINGVNGTYIYRIKFTGKEYICTQETTGGVINNQYTIVTTKRAKQLMLSLRYGFTSENYNYCDWMELYY